MICQESGQATARMAMVWFPGLHLWGKVLPAGHALFRCPTVDARATAYGGHPRYRQGAQGIISRLVFTKVVLGAM